MRLNRLTISNFRQFYGTEWRLTFPRHADRNVTIIFGANGAGKTTVLNAFTWCLYGETTPAFTGPDHLVNDRALLDCAPETPVSATVNVEFEHNGETYSVSRVRSEKIAASDQEIAVVEDGRLEVSVVRDNGSTWIPNNPQDSIEQVLPRRLHAFFFFDGERMEYLTRMEGGQEIERAVKNVLGLELLERSTKHLRGKVETVFNEELRKYGSDQVRELSTRYEEVKNRREQLESDRIEAGKNKKALEEELEDIRIRLRGLEETKELQEAIDECDEEVSLLEQNIRRIDADLRERINRSGYTVFLDDIVQACEAALEESREKGELPAPLKVQFVDDLLEKGTCICGASLQPGTTAYMAVEQWRGRAGLPDVENAAASLSAQLRNYRESAERFVSDSRTLHRDRAEFKNQKLGVEEKISEYKAQLGDRGKENEEIKELNEAARKRQEELQLQHRKEGEIETKIQHAEEELRELEALLKKAEEKDKRAQLAQRRLEVAREASNFFDGLYNVRSHQVRKEIDNRVREVYTSIAYTGNWPELTEDYQLVVRKSAPGSKEGAIMDVQKGTGENQLLSLAFIGGIAAYARDRYNDDEEEASSFGFSGGLFPLVIDSPFGVLDENYQAPLAEGLPNLANQVVLLVSSKQGLGTVIKMLEQRIDRTFVLARSTPKKDSKQVIAVHGQEVPYLQHSDEEKVEVIEVEP